MWESEFNPESCCYRVSHPEPGLVNSCCPSRRNSPALTHLPLPPACQRSPLLSVCGPSGTFPIHLGSLSLWGISLRDPWAQAGGGGCANLSSGWGLPRTLGASGWREGKSGRLYPKARANHFLAQCVSFLFRKMGLITALYALGRRED